MLPNRRSPKEQSVFSGWRQEEKAGGLEAGDTFEVLVETRGSHVTKWPLGAESCRWLKAIKEMGTQVL